MADSVLIDGHFVPFTSHGIPWLPMEEVIHKAITDFKKWLHTGAACDEFLAEHLIIPMALTNGVSRITTTKITSNMLTISRVIQEFLLVDIVLEERADGTGLITVGPV